ncbi:hypothetical protein NDU88_002480 [Pleurodeles waltl]|uniref:SCAN box domain-containing protein n=1 Tax=Pleurodeles waltl TaxID=8319 RepID=A0AAV7NE40_PLEWA|nr:hypothetical protein NDU88_002480 [Pleurodeles waltl]
MLGGKTASKPPGKLSRQLLFSEALRHQKVLPAEEHPLPPPSNMADATQSKAMDRILQEIPAVGVSWKLAEPDPKGDLGSLAQGPPPAWGPSFPPRPGPPVEQQWTTDRRLLEELNLHPRQEWRYLQLKHCLHQGANTIRRWLKTSPVVTYLKAWGQHRGIMAGLYEVLIRQLYSQPLLDKLRLQWQDRLQRTLDLED